MSSSAHCWGRNGLLGAGVSIWSAEAFKRPPVGPEPGGHYRRCPRWIGAGRRVDDALGSCEGLGNLPVPGAAGMGGPLSAVPALAPGGGGLNFLLWRCAQRAFPNLMGPRLAYGLLLALVFSPGGPGPTSSYC